MLSNVREASLTLLYKQSFPHQPLPLFFLSFEVNKTKKKKNPAAYDMQAVNFSDCYKALTLQTPYVNLI